jgi:hypothetical protein
LPGGTEENRETLTQDSCVLAPEYNYRVLPLRSVVMMQKEFRIEFTSHLARSSLYSSAANPRHNEMRNLSRDIRGFAHVSVLPTAVFVFTHSVALICVNTENCLGFRTKRRKFIGGRAACHLLSRWFPAQLIFSTPKMEAICPSETLVDFRRTTRRYIPEDGTLHNHHCENLKSYIIMIAVLVCSPILKMEAVH